MNSESFDIVERIVQRRDFDFAAIARTGIDFSDVKRASEDPLSGFLD